MIIRLRTLALSLALVAAPGCRPDGDARARDAKAIDAKAQVDAALSAIAVQPIIISALANAVPLTDAGRADVTDRLEKLQMRLDEAKNQKTTEAMKKLDDARKAAWDALDRAPRTDRSS